MSALKNWADVFAIVKESANSMIEINFRTADGPILIQVCSPVATPEAKWPWAIEVRTNGRPQTLVGEDPLEALEMAVRFTAAYLSEREGLDPPVKPLAPLDGMSSTDE